MIALSMVILSQSPLSIDKKAGEVQDARVVLTLKDGRKVLLNSRVKIDKKGIFVLNLPYRSEEIRSLIVHMKGSSEEKPPELMVWQEGSVPVDTTLDAWKDTTVDVGGTPVEITKVIGIANVGTYDVLARFNVGSSGNAIMGFTQGKHTAALYGIGDADSTYGVYGYVPSGYSGGIGIMGDVTGGGSFAVYGLASGSSSESGVGIVGARISGSTVSYYNNTGITGTSDFGIGVAGYSEGYAGVYGYTTDITGWGVYSAFDLGVNGDIYGFGDAYIDGNLDVTGDLNVSGNKNFRIPHPLDPNKYLVHHALESNEVLNVYRGTVVLDENGEAVVQLPDYFKEININFSYQLTPVGAPMPNLYIKREINGNTFVIGGGKPGYKVSWTVYAQRYDEYIRNHPESAKDEVPRSALKMGKIDKKKMEPKVLKKRINVKGSEIKNLKVK